MSTCCVTVVSANYLAYAKVLGASLAEHFPDARFQVLIVDRRSPEVDAAVVQLGLNCVFAEDLGLPDAENIFYKYDIVELNTALKPTFLKRVLAEGFDKVIYLDPDTCLFAPISAVTDALDTHEIVLTPHALAPAMDGLRPSDIDFLRNGCYNLGFAAFRQGAESGKILDWWEQRCLLQGYNDTPLGVFVDQKWMDLVPSFSSSIFVLRDPAYNVAYWNLHERSVTFDQRYLVNGKPLAFFHFSGVKATSPGVLSRHQDRHQLQPGTALAELVADYAGRLLAAGHKKLSSMTYSFGVLDDGKSITRNMRRALDCWPKRVPQPFSSSSEFQQTLAKLGITPSNKTKAGISMNTLNLDQDDKRIKAVNKLIRFGARMIGVERVFSALQYAQFVLRGSNYPAILLEQRFTSSHGQVDNKSV